MCRRNLSSLTCFGSAEYKDDGHIIPRSSSVIAKRVPAAKPGKGRGAMYLTAAAPTTTSSEPGKEKQMTTSPMKGRVGTGAMSVRFDSKDDPSEARASVRPISLLPAINHDEPYMDKDAQTFRRNRK